MTPDLCAGIWFIVFIASMMRTVWPSETREPMLFQKPDDRCEVNDLRARNIERADELEALLKKLATGEHGWPCSAEILVAPSDVILSAAKDLAASDGPRRSGLDPSVVETPSG